MYEFNLDLAETFALHAAELAKKKNESINTKRVALYNALVSIEISLKHLLERAGWNRTSIKSLNHDLCKLLHSVAKCTINTKITPTHTRRVPASKLYAIEVVDVNGATGTVGGMVEGMYDPLQSASKYPNEIRYGATVKHFPADAVANLALKIVHWAKEHADSIKYDLF